MKKGLIGPYQLGTVSGFSDALKIAEDITKEPGADLEGIFYATAFQAGVDEFLIAEVKDHPRPHSQFIIDRTSYTPSERTGEHWKLVHAAFSAYLPDGWDRAQEYSSARTLQWFLIDLLDAMSAKASLLSASRIPEIPQGEVVLPSELSIPLFNLLSAISEVQTPGLILQRAVSTDDIERFKNIISSDLFSGYSHAQSALDDLKVPPSEILPKVIVSARNLFLRHGQLFTLRKSGIGILQLTPKVIDTVFGKLPGILAEFAAKLGIDLLESQRRIVIYDLRNTIRDIFLANLVRMLQASKVKHKVEEMGKKGIIE